MYSRLDCAYDGNGKACGVETNDIRFNEDLNELNLDDHPQRRPV